MILGRPLAEGMGALRAPLAYRASRGLVLEALGGGGEPLWRFVLSDELDALDVDGRRLPLAAAGARVVHPIALSEDERAAWQGLLDEAGVLPPFAQLDRPVHHRLEGPAPLARALGVIPPLGAARIARGLPARGYLPDTVGGRGLVERSMRFLGPYLIIVTHEPFSTNPYNWRDRRTHRLTGVEVRRGRTAVPSERLWPAVYSEIVAGLRSL